jgi:hypothetical protein
MNLRTSTLAVAVLPQGVVLSPATGAAGRQSQGLIPRPGQEMEGASPDAAGPDALGERRRPGRAAIFAR